MANVDGENNHALDSLPEPRQAYDLSHHMVDFPLELQYRELVAIQFGSFALSRSPLMSRKVAKRSIKYLWSITLDLLPYDGPPQLPQITAHDIAYAISYLGSLIKRGKGVARLLAIADFDPLTRTYPEDDISFLCSNPSPNLAEGTISIRFALDEFNTGSYLKLSFTEWNQEYSWTLFGELWDSAEEIQGGTYLDGVQRSLAEQLSLSPMMPKSKANIEFPGIPLSSPPQSKATSPSTPTSLSILQNA
ncbi:hypothetical protein FRC05_007148 [Tulasnella sp. 425]|nr:hypothetical protein FRC05_007148 [Tulasnella sp. 425]